MSKQIEEVMALVDAYAAMQGVEPHEKQIEVHDAIEAKLRELVERKPQTVESCAERLNDAGHEFWLACHNQEYGGGAIRWVEYSDGSLIIFTRGEYRDRLMSVAEGMCPAPTVVFEKTDEDRERETRACIDGITQEKKGQQ